MFQWTSERFITTRWVTEVSWQRIPSRWSNKRPTTKWAESITRHKKLVTTRTRSWWTRGAPTRITWSRSVRWCLAVGLVCGDQRRLTGNGSALEVVFHDDALYKSTTLLYLHCVCGQLALQSCYVTASRAGVEPATSYSPVRRRNHCTRRHASNLQNYSKARFQTAFCIDLRCACSRINSISATRHDL